LEASDEEGEVAEAEAMEERERTSVVMAEKSMMG
jgi:hypothetical protein